jgi:thioredoxin-related protein
MKKSFFLFGFFLLCYVPRVNAQVTPKNANDILTEACQLAGKDKKNVFIIFHASWCGWCHKMDTSMNDNAVRKFFDDNFIIRHLVVYESKEKKNLENPGAIELLTKYGGNDDGIPYWLIFDKNGNLLADSQIKPDGSGMNTKGKNSGCPANEEEVNYFITVLKKTTALTTQQLVLIKERFRKNE